MLLVGLTGGIASGKSSVSELLTNRGVSVVDADAVYAKLSKRGGWAWRRVVKSFGKSILRDDGELDRAKLGEIVFSDPKMRKKLDKAVKFPIWAALMADVAWHWFSCKKMIVLDIPLLFESGLYRITRPIIVVFVSQEMQIRRLMDRDETLSKQHATRRIAAQLSTEEKKKRADIVIDNSGDRDDLKLRVDEVLKQLEKASTMLWLATTPYGCMTIALAASFTLRFIARSVLF